MDDAAHAELRALQARAYGPGDGLGTDAAARRRLAELEAQSRVERARPPVVEGLPELPPRVTHAAPPPLPTVPAAVAAVAAAPTSASADTGVDPDARRRRILTGITWAGSLAMVATLAVGVTAAATSRTAWIGGGLPAGAAVTHVATLAVDPDREIPEYLGAPGSDQGSAYEAFADLVPVVSDVEVGEGRLICVQVITDDDWEEGPDSFWYSGCSYAPFSAAASLVVTPGLPAPLRERFPTGTRLQFVVGDGVVDVFAADAPVEQAAG